MSDRHSLPPRTPATAWKSELLVFGLAAPFGACLSYYAMGADTWLGEGMAPIGLLGVIVCLTCWFGYLVRVLVQVACLALRRLWHCRLRTSSSREP